MEEKDAADFDLERFIEMFDRAMTSSDPRVKNALRQLMMMVILTDTSSDHESGVRASHGPLRRLQEDVRDQFRWIQRLEKEIHSLKNQLSYHEMQRQGNNTALQGAKVSGEYPDVQAEQSQSSIEYWKSVVALTNQQKEIKKSSSVLNNPNIKVAQDTGEK